MTQPASAAQIRKIHALARELRLEEDDRRALMARETGKSSSKELDVREAIRVIDTMERLTTGAQRAAPKRLAKGALKLDGPFVAKVRALWISLHHLGAINNPTDVAMVAFVKRQTGIEHARWASQALHEPAAAMKVIEGLKKIAERHGVDWSAEEPDGQGGKRAVYLAIRRALTAAGVDPQFVVYPGRVGIRSFSGARLDELTGAAAGALRRARGGA